MTLPGNLDSSKIVAWYAARLMTLNDGDPIVSLTDHSGNGRHALQPQAIRRATFQTNEINGEPVFRFAGGQFYKALWELEIPEPYAIFGYFNLKTLQNDEVIWSGYAANAVDKHLLAFSPHDIPIIVSPYSPPPNWVIEQAGQNRHVIGGTPLANTWYVAEVDYESLDRIVVNGDLVVTGDAGHVASNGITIGAREDGNRFLTGDIAEIVVTRNLIEVEKATVFSGIGGVPIPDPIPDPIPIPDNTGDRTEELNTKIAALPVGGTFDMGGRDKSWRVDGQVVVDSRVLFNGRLDGRKHDGINSVRHVVLKGTKPKCNQVVVEGPGSSHPTTFGWHGFAFYGAIDGVLNGCEAFNVFGDFVYVGYRQDGHEIFPSENVVIDGVNGHEGNRMGFAAVAVKRMRIRRGKITMPRQWCIDIEPAKVEMPVTDIMIDGVKFGEHKFGLLAVTGYGARGKYGPITMRNCESLTPSIKELPIIFGTIPDGEASRGPLTVTNNKFTQKGSVPVFKLEAGWIALTEPNTILAG